MPVMDGIAATKAIRAMDRADAKILGRHKDAIVVVICNYNDKYSGQCYNIIPIDHCNDCKCI